MIRDIGLALLAVAFAIVIGCGNADSVTDVTIDDSDLDIAGNGGSTTVVDEGSGVDANGIGPGDNNDNPVAAAHTIRKELWGRWAFFLQDENGDADRTKFSGTIEIKAGEIRDVSGAGVYEVVEESPEKGWTIDSINSGSHRIAPTSTRDRLEAFLVGPAGQEWPEVGVRN